MTASPASSRAVGDRAAERLMRAISCILPCGAQRWIRAARLAISYSDSHYPNWSAACISFTPILIWRAFVAKGFVAITVERCKGCGFCVEFCPTHVLALSSAYNAKGYHPPHVVSAEKCSGCDLCGMYCPDFAIFGARHAR